MSDERLAGKIDTGYKTRILLQYVSRSAIMERWVLVSSLVSASHGCPEIRRKDRYRLYGKNVVAAFLQLECPKTVFLRLGKLINWHVVLPQANNKQAKFHRDPLRFGPPPASES